MLSLVEVKESLPVNFRNNITQIMVDQLNNLSKDPEQSRYMRENFVSFSQVLQEGRFKLSDYVTAVMYVSKKVMGMTNHMAYKETFPERFQGMIDAGKQPKDISSVICGYNRGILVTKITERAIVPSWILNQDMHQKALQVQHDLMMDDDVSSKVRCEAANSLLTHLKKPDAVKTGLQVNIAINDGISALEDSLRQLSEQQRKTIQHSSEISIKDIAETELISVEE